MIDRTPLPPALKGDRSILTGATADEIARLAGARPIAFTMQLVSAWAVIFGAVAWAEWVGALWATILAIVIVGTRLNVLGLLVHEQAHQLGYRGRYGNLLVDLFAAYPMLVLTVEGYAQVHLAHHRSYFTDQDPDFLRKHGEEWSFPKPIGAIARLFALDVLGINTVKLIRGKRASPGVPVPARRAQVPRWVRPLYYLAIAALLTWSGAWTLFLVYWMIPILTVLQVIVRWGAICEHKYNLPQASVVESTPLIVLRWWERVLLPNLNFAMHPYHHFFPGVAFSNLPKVHAIYLREGLVNPENVFVGYAAYFRHLVADASRQAPTGRSG